MSLGGFKSVYNLMIKKSIDERWSWMFLTVAFVAGLFVFSAFQGWRTLDAFYGTTPYQGVRIDAQNVIERSLVVAETRDPFATVDPPLRYVPLAILYGLFDVSKIQAERIAGLYTATMAYVAVPVSVAALYYHSSRRSWRLAALIIAGFVSWRVIGLGVNSYLLSRWHYSPVLPAIFLCLIFLHYSVLADETNWRATVATAISLGVIGLTELIYGALLAATITVVYLYHKQYKNLATVGGIGVLFALPLVVVPNRVDGLVERELFGRILRFEKYQSPSGAFSDTLAQVLTPGYFFLTALTIVTVAGLWYTRRPLSNSGALEGALLVFTGFWLIFEGFPYIGVLSNTAQFVTQYLLLGSVVAVGVSMFDESSIRIRPLEIRTSIVAIASIAVFGLTIWLLSQGPIAA